MSDDITTGSAQHRVDDDRTAEYGGQPRFPLGHIVVTPAVLAVTQRLGPMVWALLLSLVARHGAGDWGDLDAHDRRVNEHALHVGGRLLSAYRLPDGTDTLWIITEEDRSATTILLPADY